MSVRLPLLLLLLLAACASPNRFGTARTLPAGESSHSLVVDLFDTRGRTALEEIPVLPAPRYVLRHGLTDRLELGLEFASLTGLGLDLKANVLRTGLLDLALAPGVSAYHLDFGHDANASWVQLDLPLLVGINAGRDITFVAHAGPTGLYLADTEADPFRALGAMVGLSVQLRGASVALQPGIHWLVPFAADRPGLYGGPVASLGLHFGARPSYDDAR